MVTQIAMDSRRQHPCTPQPLSRAGYPQLVQSILSCLGFTLCLCGGKNTHGMLATNFCARSAEAEQLLQVYGRNELEEKTTSKLIIFLKLVRSY